MNISRALFRVIEEYALSARTSEVCGFLYNDRFVPLMNRSSDPYQFDADPAETVSALANYGEPEAIFHTHPNGSLELSEDDKKNYYPNSTIVVGTVVNRKLQLRIYRRDAEVK